jgi:hypothetical protein
LLRLNDTSCCVVFARDTSSGQVTIDGQGRPVVHYRPCATTSRHLLDVRISPVSFFQLHQIVANKPPHGAATVLQRLFTSCFVVNAVLLLVVPLPVQPSHFESPSSCS